MIAIVGLVGALNYAPSTVIPTQPVLERTFPVQKEPRNFDVPTENREKKVPYEVRAFKVGK